MFCNRNWFFQSFRRLCGTKGKIPQVMLYPIGIQNFEKIREGGYVYVDKTELIYNIVKKVVIIS